MQDQNPNSVNADARKAALLILGTVLSVLSNLRFAIPELAWVAGAPFLIYGIQYTTRRDYGWLFLAVLVSSSLTVAKIVTPPIGYWMIPLFSFPMAVTAFVLLWLVFAVYRRIGLHAFVFSYAALSASSEWLTYTFSEQSSWGSLAFTQADRLELVQLGSIAGIAGLSFLIALGSSLAAGIYLNGLKANRVSLAVFFAFFLAANVYGSYRLNHDSQGRRVSVAAIASPVPVEKISGIIANPALAETYEDTLFSRSKTAVERGARVIVWTEAGTLTTKEREPALLLRARKFAMEHGIHLVMAHAVLVSSSPVQMENKYLWIEPNGNTADDYWKRHPVPGEGSIQGKSRAKIIDVEGAAFSGAICYDFDFPHISRELALDGAQIIVVPSSDWKGIDPLHSRMARYMAVSAGTAVVRSVRASESFAADSRGRILASMGANDPDGIMIASVPAETDPTLYRRTGDVFAWICAVFSLLCAGRTFGRFLLEKRANQHK
jgi:apolipoprotein N-acyltransferase